MTRTLLIPLILLMVIMYWTDRKKLQQAPAINRWVTYVLYAGSITIWEYALRTPNTTSLSTWLNNTLAAWIPLP